MIEKSKVFSGIKMENENMNSEKTIKYDLEYIIQQYKRKSKLKYVFFWGDTERGNEVTKACLSQWYPSVFTADGITYSTAEQYMMAQKAQLFQDKAIYKEIMTAKHPKQCKALGQQVKNFSQTVWDAHKFQIVVDGNMAKFSQNPKLKEFLLQTGDRVLAEASPYDKIWGIGMTEDNEKVINPLEWNGQNLLGFALMEVRRKLKGINDIK